MKLHTLFFSALVVSTSNFIAPDASANANFADIAKATCSGKLSGLKEIQKGAFEQKSTSAMMWLRWLYVTEKCQSTYIGFGPKASEPLLMAAEAGDAGAALTVGQHMLNGTGGFDADIEAGKKYLYQSANSGETDAAIVLAEEFVSGKKVKQDLALAQKLVAWVKQRDHSNNFRIRALEMELRRSQSASNKAQTKVAQNKSQKSQKSQTFQKQASKPQQTNSGNVAGGKGELVYAGMPLQQECWRYVDIKTALTDSRITVTHQNEISTAKRDAVRAGKDQLTVTNFYFFNAVLQDIRDRSKLQDATGVAEKISFYGPNKPPKCTVSTTSFSTRNDMLASIKKHYGRVWPAKKLNWRLVSLPRETLGKLKEVGIVIR
ncbi:hypothetical protein [uncultured Cohaesibacter sp.]|uniref:hypothetical protein n=1 Tax=uncultured Cohaesibacter sp. TaxID=1002546 RepID=UPI0029C8DBBE|nr:hypothetical protein [uncultured Cohaesibacter sp.]